MNEEEKKAIEEIEKELKREIKEFGDYNDYRVLSSLYMNGDIETALNLIKKQQKEIEEKQTIIYAGAEKVKGLEKEIENLKQDNKLLIENRFREVADKNQYIKDTYIPKSKIEDKIKELIKEGNYKTIENPKGRVHFAKEETDFKIQVLKELLGE